MKTTPDRYGCMTVEFTAEEIKRLADGQMVHHSGQWITYKKETVDIVLNTRLFCNPVSKEVVAQGQGRWASNVRCTFDGLTYALKSVEII